MNYKRKKIIILLLVLSLVLVTIGTTYAFFTYTGTGTTLSTITTGGITFHYDEKKDKGHGINIINANPVASNNDAKSSNNYFEFKITSTTMNEVTIPYTVTARMSSNSDSAMGNIVNMYLTEVSGSETPTELFSSNLPKYSELEDYENRGDYIEKVIYTDTVTSASYDKTFRLRMWIDQNANMSGEIQAKYFCGDTDVTSEYNSNYECSNGVKPSKKNIMTSDYNNKEFSVTVNVNAVGAKKQVQQASNNPKLLTRKKYVIRCTCDNRKLSWDGEYYDENNIPMDCTVVDDPNIPEPNRYKCGCDTDDDGQDDEEGTVENTGEEEIEVPNGDRTRLNEMILEDNIVSNKTINLKDSEPSTSVVTGYTDNNFNGTTKRTTITDDGDYYYTYASDYTYNESTKKYTLVNPQVCQYKNCYETLKGKYIWSNYGSNYNGVVTSEASAIQLVLDDTTADHMKYQTLSNNTLQSRVYDWYISPYITYSDTYSFNKSTGKFTLNNPQTCSYRSCYEQIKGKYVASTSANATTTSPQSANNVTNIYKVAEASTETKLYYIQSSTSKAYVDNSGFYKQEINGQGYGGTRDGGTTFYFRGNIDNNVVEFANLTWRVIRINEDGSTRLILDDMVGTGAYYSYYYNNNDTDLSSAYLSTGTSIGNSEHPNVMYMLNNWYKENIKDAGFEANIADGSYFCEQAKVYTGPQKIGNADSIGDTYYTPDLKCTEDGNGYGLVNSKIGLLTYDEAVFAGTAYEPMNKTYFLYKHADGTLNDQMWWLMSPESYDPTYSTYRAWSIGYDGRFHSIGVANAQPFRPVINLKASTTATRSNGHYIVDVD